MHDPVVDEIKSRINIAEVVQEYLPLKKAGTNWKGLCPFHNEKSPSFMVSEDRMIFHCFGCGEGGDVFTFLQKIEGYEFPEALKLLADRAGVKIERHDPKIQHARNTYVEVIDLAARFYHKVLTDTPQAESARKYLLGRGLNIETIKRFGLGFAPEGWETLSKFLAKYKIKEDDSVAVGLTMHSMNGRGLYDRFRKRIMFPIRNVQGAVVGFTGRLLPEDEKNPEAGGKYVNTPETPLYHKGEVLFGLDMARQMIRREDLAVIVEGNMDVISSHQAGIANVVAASGTALTDAQLRLIARYTRRIAVAFDADAAGDKAAYRGITTALRNGFSVRVIVIPEGAGKDPDDCVRKDPALWKKAIMDSKDIMDYLLARSRAKYDLKSADGKKSAFEDLVPVIAECSDPVSRSHYIHIVGEALGIQESLILDRLHAQNPTIKQKSGSEESEIGIQPSWHRKASERILALLMVHPETREIALPKLKPEHLDGEDLRDLYKTAVLEYSDTHTTPSDLSRSERTAELKAYIPLLLDAMPAAEPVKETIEILQNLMTAFRKTERERLEALMREAEQRGDRERIAQLSKLFETL